MTFTLAAISRSVTRRKIRECLFGLESPGGKFSVILTADGRYFAPNDLNTSTRLQRGFHKPMAPIRFHIRRTNPLARHYG
jgi:hypothetical protein